MGDNNYNIDDILAEIDAKRKKNPSEESDKVSVTEIIGGNDLEQAMSSAGIKRRRSEQQAAEQASQEEADRRAEEMQAAAAAKEEYSDGLVNINTAGPEELKTLPGIGESKARSIIAYREEHGAFAAIEDIKKIDGIKDGVFASLKDCIKVD